MPRKKGIGTSAFLNQPMDLDFLFQLFEFGVAGDKLSFSFLGQGRRAGVAVGNSAARLVNGRLARKFQVPAYTQ